MATNKRSIEDLKGNIPIKQLLDNVGKAPENKNFSVSARLWLQYIVKIKFILLYIQADRIGDSEFHLYCSKSMMPYFLAAGHIFYAKYAHLHVQQMEELKEKMESTEYKKFSEGCFTIRRTDRVWGGVAQDIKIE
ncbi:hypothetical protein AVEN_191468-1 [Araneus ventricosus]|uniref:Uncharacterized protein n=1 Tax=Araneus ventricosus TaxID=182803 RepID=A0A4Y2V4J7_ARAVE|nr:hypothetical protein AVEN_191468-1 [Araneus ventricosus]